jgi:hypothetical protein
VEVNLLDLVRSRRPDRQAIACALDACTPAARLAAIRALPRQAQVLLYEAVADAPARHLDDLVPADHPPLTPVMHWGINSMPMARGFAKVMYRQHDGRVAGYNAQVWRWLTGPGYFTVREQPGAGLLIDYGRLPSEAPRGWPRIRSNRRGMSYFVYRDLQDTLRRVSEHVSIGQASRNGREMANWFILVREDSALAQALPAPTLDLAAAAAS